MIANDLVKTSDLLRSLILPSETIPVAYGLFSLASLQAMTIHCELVAVWGMKRCV
jgi:hypothetical protein